MKANTLISPELLDNSNEFNDDFFKKYTLHHASNPLRLSDEIYKNYFFPTFYKNVTCTMGVFLCDYSKAKAMLPHPSMQPVSMFKNRALVIFSCYEYKKVLGIKPYNEIAMTIPVLVNNKINIPLLPLLYSKIRGFGYYVFNMPVTSLENQIRGTKIWGLPKVVEQIDITTGKDYNTCQAFDYEGNTPYFSLKIPVQGKNIMVNETGYLYSIKNNSLVKSKTQFEGSFKIKKYTQQLFTTHKNDYKSEYLQITGESNQAKILKNLQIHPYPLQIRTCENMNSMFELPQIN